MILYVCTKEAKDLLFFLLQVITLEKIQELLWTAIKRQHANIIFSLIASLRDLAGTNLIITP